MGGNTYSNLCEEREYDNTRIKEKEIKFEFVIRAPKKLIFKSN